MNCAYATKVIIVDEQTLFIQALSAALNYQGFDTVALLNSRNDLLDHIRNTQPDMVLLGFNKIDSDNLIPYKLISSSYPDLVLIVFSTYDYEEIETRAKLLGAKGYFSKDIELRHLLDYLHRLVKGNSNVMVNYSSSDKALNGECMKFNGRLSKREVEITRLVKVCYTSKQIAEQLFISINTVEKHRTNIFKKLCVKNVHGLMTYDISLYLK